MRYVVRLSSFLLIAALVAAPALAQETGARVAGSYAGAFGEGATNIAAGGAVGYRFTPHIGFEIEALALPDLEFNDTDRDGRGVVFLSNFVAEFPNPARWVLPYVQGGGGIASLSQSGFAMPVDARGGGFMDPRVIAPRGSRVPMPGPIMGRDARTPMIDRMEAIDIADVRAIGPRRSETGVALSVGGGIDFKLWQGLSAGPTISYLRLFSTVTDRDLTRIGLRTSYRF